MYPYRDIKSYLFVKCYIIFKKNNTLNNRIYYFTICMYLFNMISCQLPSWYFIKVNHGMMVTAKRKWWLQRNHPNRGNSDTNHKLITYQLWDSYSIYRCCWNVLKFPISRCRSKYKADMAVSVLSFISCFMW